MLGDLFIILKTGKWKERIKHFPIDPVQTEI